MCADQKAAVFTGVRPFGVVASALLYRLLYDFPGLGLGRVAGSWLPIPVRGLVGRSKAQNYYSWGRGLAGIRSHRSHDLVRLALA